MAVGADRGQPVGPAHACRAARAAWSRLWPRITKRCLGFYGRDLGLRVARKHLGWYAEAGGGCPWQARRAVLTATDPAQVLALLPDLLTPVQEVAA